MKHFHDEKKIQYKIIGRYEGERIPQGVMQDAGLKADIPYDQHERRVKAIRVALNPDCWVIVDIETKRKVKKQKTPTVNEIRAEKIRSRAKTPTMKNASHLQWAYSFFNQMLFNGELPECLITMHYSARGNVMGYYSRNKFSATDKRGQVDELFLNTKYFHLGDMETLQTLVHEMVHVWQFHFGKPGKRGYHNKEFARKMREIGLQASSTGKPGGKDTGVNMADYIIRGAAFECWAWKLFDSGFKIPYRETVKQSAPNDLPALPFIPIPGIPDVPVQPTTPKKTRYVCPVTGARVWGKPGLLLRVGDSPIPMIEG